MSAEASIPHPPLPGKDPPLSSLLPSIPASNVGPTSASRSMPPPPRPQIHSTSTSSIPIPVSIPDFAPFFTRITDASTASTHHPSRIHYIFSDDDESEVLTAACVRSIRSGGQEAEAASEAESEGDVRRRGKDEEREEHVLIVDVNATGDGIVSTSSLSAGWQIMNAELASAPTFNSEGTDGNGERGLMLTIEGVGVGEEGASMEDSGRVNGVGESVMGEEEMQTLLDGFDQKMAILRKIVKVGEEWSVARKEKEGSEDDAHAEREV